MPYTKLLNELIEQSGMTAKEVAEKCQAMGANVTPSYLSMIRNEKTARVPSDDVSVALAKVLGKDENTLVIERIMDAAPQPLRDAIFNLSLASLGVMAKATGTPLDEANISAMETALRQQPLADIVLQMAKKIDVTKYNAKDFTAQYSENGANTTIQVSGIPEFDVQDEAMYPTLQKGDKVKIIAQQEYHNGDIVAFVYLKKEETPMQYRQLQKADSTSLLVAFNSDYKPEIVDLNKIAFVGRVAAVTRIL